MNTVHMKVFTDYMSIVFINKDGSLKVRQVQVLLFI